MFRFSLLVILKDSPSEQGGGGAVVVGGVSFLSLEGNQASLGDSPTINARRMIFNSQTLLFSRFLNLKVCCGG